MQKVLQEIVKFFCSLFFNKKNREVKRALILVRAAATQSEVTFLALSTAAALAQVQEEIEQTTKRFNEQLESATQPPHVGGAQVVELSISVSPKCVVAYLLLRLDTVRATISQLAGMVEAGQKECLCALKMVIATKKVLAEEGGQPQETARWDSLHLTLAATLKIWQKADDAVQEARKIKSTAEVMQTFQPTSAKADEIAYTISPTLVLLCYESSQLSSFAAKWVQAAKTINVTFLNALGKIHEIKTLEENEQ
jgi:hypothetical protein